MLDITDQPNGIRRVDGTGEQMFAPVLLGHHEWRDHISPTIGYITLCPNLPVPQT